MEKNIFDDNVLCGASAYEEKYYFNHRFDNLPEDVKGQLKVICILFTQDVGGTFLMRFDQEGSLCFETFAAASDYDYDDIGAELLIRQIEKTRAELISSLELYYRAFILGETIDFDQNGVMD